VTILDLLSEALITCGIIGPYDDVKDALAAVAFKALLGMVDTATADPAKTFTRSFAAYTLTPGKYIYIIGPSAVALGLTPPITVDFDAPCPTSIEQANIINLSVPAFPIRTPLYVMTDAEWSAISLLNAPTPIPKDLYFDNNFPTGNLYLHGIPNAANQLEIWTRQPLTVYSAYTDTFLLPPAYYEAYLYGLCMRLYPRFGKTPDPTVTALLKDALRILESANLDVPILGLDSGLPGGKPPYFDARTNRQL
jgi:hypothetical protein